MSDTHKTSRYRDARERLQAIYAAQPAGWTGVVPRHQDDVVEPLYRYQESAGTRYGNQRRARAAWKVIGRRIDRRSRQREIEVE